MSVESEACSGRPFISQNEEVIEKVCQIDLLMFVCFFDPHGIVDHKYAPEGQTINKEYYLEILRRLCDAVQRKWPDMWTGNNWQLHHGNVPAHSTHVIKVFWPKAIWHLCNSLFTLLI